MAFEKAFSIWVLVGILAQSVPCLASSDDLPQQVVLVVREKQLLAFSSSRGSWVFRDLMAQEWVQGSKTASHVAVVVTNLRVLGFSGETGLWAEERLEVGERIMSMEADGKVGSVVTNVRALAFGARMGTWEVVRFPLK